MSSLCDIVWFLLYCMEVLQCNDEYNISILLCLVFYSAIVLLLLLLSLWLLHVHYNSHQPTAGDDEDDNNDDDDDVFEQTFIRLARSGFLFKDVETTSDTSQQQHQQQRDIALHKVTISSMLPRDGTLSAFHKCVIQYCGRKELPHLLRCYLGMMCDV